MQVYPGGPLRDYVHCWASDNVQHDQHLGKVIAEPILRSMIGRQRAGEDVLITVPQVRRQDTAAYAGYVSMERIPLPSAHADIICESRHDARRVVLTNRFAPILVQVCFDTSHSLHDIITSGLTLLDATYLNVHYQLKWSKSNWSFNLEVDLSMGLSGSCCVHVELSKNTCALYNTPVYS